MTFFNIEDALLQFYSVDDQFVYFGIFFASFIMNIMILIPIQIYPILVISVFDKKLDPNFVAIYSAIGITIPKTLIFYLVYYGHYILVKKSRTNKKIISPQKLASKYGWKAAIVAAVTPIPDDIVYISLGLARYSPWKFVTSTFVGKLVINEIVVWAAVYSGKPFIDKFAYHDTIEPFNMAISIIISIFIAVAIIYTFMRVDLEKVIRKYFPRAFVDEKTE